MIIKLLFAEKLIFHFSAIFFFSAFLTTYHFSTLFENWFSFRSLTYRTLRTFTHSLL